MITWDMWVMLIGTLLGLVGLTFLFLGNTWAFSFVEHLYLGGTVAIALIQSIYALKSNCFDLIGGGRVLLVIPLIVGLLSFARYTTSRWLARYPVALLSGIGVGVTLGLVLRAQILNAASLTIGAVVSQSPDLISSVVILVGVLIVLVYFTYSQRFSAITHPGGKLGWIGRVGRLFAMSAFGYLWAKIFIDEAIDAQIATMIVLVKRTVDAFILGHP
jgi:hypothetical protein